MRSSASSNGTGTDGRSVPTTVSGTTVCRAQQPKSYMFSGIQRGRKIISGGSAGSSSQDHRPSMANQTRVNTRVRSSPPAPWMYRAAVRIQAASAGSPASRSAAYASTVVDRSGGPPKNVAQLPSARCLDRIQRAVCSVSTGSLMPRNVPEEAGPPPRW